MFCNLFWAWKAVSTNFFGCMHAVSVLQFQILNFTSKNFVRHPSLKIKGKQKKSGKDEVTYIHKIYMFRFWSLSHLKRELYREETQETHKKRTIQERHMDVMNGHPILVPEMEQEPEQWSEFLIWTFNFRAISLFTMRMHQYYSEEFCFFYKIWLFQKKKIN